MIRRPSCENKNRLGEYIATLHKCHPVHQHWRGVEGGLGAGWAMGWVPCMHPNEVLPKMEALKCTAPQLVRGLMKRLACVLPFKTCPFAGVSC